MTALQALLSTPVSPDLERAIRTLLLQRLQASGAEEVAIRAIADHHGDPIVVVEVKHHFVAEPLVLKDIIDAERAARDLAWEKGERRFVHFRHEYDERQEVADLD